MGRNRLEKIIMFFYIRKLYINHIYALHNIFLKHSNKYNSMDYIKIKAMVNKALKTELCWVLPRKKTNKGTSEPENELDVKSLNLVYFFNIYKPYLSPIAPSLETKSQPKTNLVDFKCTLR